MSQSKSANGSAARKVAPRARTKAKPNGNGKGNGRRSILHRPARLPGRPTVVARFGKFLGKRFTGKNLAILAQAHSAYSALKRSRHAIQGRGANIFTQWIGDPDALGSAVVLQAILEQLGAKQVRILTGSLGHPQNRNLVERCGLTLYHPNQQRLPRGLHCMVDASPPLGMSNTTFVEPVREYFFVADHHADPEEVERDCASQGVRRVKLSFAGLPVGSTSAFMTALGCAFEVLETMTPEGRAAAALGIYTDTSALLHGATPLDFRMFEKLTRDEATRAVVDDLRDYRVPMEWYEYRSTAFSNMESMGRVRVAPVGYMREDHRDVVAEVANDLLRIDGASIAIAVGVTERGTEVSVRADSRLLGEDQARIIQVIDHLLAYAFPGTSGFKYDRRPPYRVEGGARVPHKEASARMWKLGSGGSLDDPTLLEHCRALTRALLAALNDLSYARPEEMKGLL